MNKIKYFRSISNITQKEVSDLLGCSPMNISHYESGRHDCSLDDARKIVIFFNSKGLKNDKGELLALDDVFPPS